MFFIKTPRLDANDIAPYANSPAGMPQRPGFSRADQLAADAFAAFRVRDDEAPNFREGVALQRRHRRHMNPADDRSSAGSDKNNIFPGAQHIGESVSYGRTSCRIP